MIGDYLIPTGPDYGAFKRGCFGAVIHDLECPRNVNVRSMTGPGSYPANANVSPHIIAGMREAAQLLVETHAGAHVGSRGNMLFVGFEVTGYAKWTKAEWMSDISNLLNQARAVANLWKRMGWKASDLKWGSLAELQEARRRYDAGLPYVAPRLWTHNDISEGLGGTNHWDPGLGFPFEEFAKWCLQYFNGSNVSPGGTPNIPDAPTEGGAETETEDDDMTLLVSDGNRIGVFQGGHLTHLDDTESASGFDKAGVKTAEISPEMFDKIRRTPTEYPLLAVTPSGRWGILGGSSLTWLADGSTVDSLRAAGSQSVSIAEADFDALAGK